MFGRLRFASVALCLLVATGGSLRAAETSLPVAQDLAAEAKSAKETGEPLIVMVSLQGCPHCEVVRRSHLLPLLRDKPGMPKPTIRQIEINGGDRLRNFDGKIISHADFARQHRIKIAPVVMFFDAQGQMLAEPLVGSMIADFYGAYFDAALAEARLKLSPTLKPG